MVLALFFLAIWACNLHRTAPMPLAEQKQWCLVCRLLCSVGIVLCHASINTCWGTCFQKEVYVGAVGIGLFMFFSGYGLQYNLKSRGREYLNGFIRKRIGRLLLPYLLASVLYGVVCRFVGNEIKIADALMSVFSPTPLLPYSWYVSEIVVVYMLWWASFRYVNYRRVQFVFAFLLILCALCIAKFYALLWWTVPLPCFLLGMMVAEYERKLAIWLSKVVLPIVFLFFMFFRQDIIPFALPSNVGHVNLSDHIVAVCAVLIVWHLIAHGEKREMPSLNRWGGGRICCLFKSGNGISSCCAIWTWLDRDNCMFSSHKCRVRNADV